MFNIIGIVNSNRSTFYNYATSSPISLWKVRAKKFFIVLALTLLCPTIPDNFLDAVLTIYSILIGFTFNILFYLLANNSIKADNSEPSLEYAERIKKLNKLGDELFYNVSYFNMVSILLIIISLVLFLKPLPLQEWNTLNQLLTEYHIFFTYLFVIAKYAYIYFFYWVLCESLFSLIRTIGRVTFFFEKKIEFQKTYP